MERAHRLTERRRPDGVALLLSALVTAAALFLVWAAFTDIAHGEADTTLEYTFLCFCAAWLAIVGAYLIVRGHAALGRVSLLMLAAAVWGQQGITAGTRASLSPSYLATVGAFAWFLAVAVVLAILGARALAGDCRGALSTGSLDRR